MIEHVYWAGVELVQFDRGALWVAMEMIEDLGPDEAAKAVLEQARGHFQESPASSGGVNG